MTELPKDLLDRLLDARRRHHYPSQVRPLSHAFAGQVLGMLFPQLASEVVCNEHAVAEDVIEVMENLARLVRGIAPLHPDVPADLPQRFARGLSQVHRLLTDDAQAIFEGDPAARSVDEVVLTYPGFHAIAVYRVAHELHDLGLPLIPRLLTEHAHEKTGIDIHPGARIGPRFCIDHGTGIVVGETTVIGQNVKLYQGVTLGALTVQKQLADRKRHPTIEDGVVVYAGATILGGETVVGQGSIVAGNAFVTRSVPPNSLVGRTGEVRARTGAVNEEIDFVI